MRILFVSPYFPIPDRSGGKVRVLNVLRELARTEDVTLACYLSRESEPFVREIEQLGVRVEAVPREVRRRPLARHARFLLSPIPFSIVDPDPRMENLVQGLWQSCEYDLIQVEFLAMAYLASDPMFKHRRFLTHHYSATDHFRRVLKIRSRRSLQYWVDRIELVKMAPYEKRLLAQFNRVFVTSEHDRRLLSSVSRDACMVVANNGVDVEFFRRSPTKVGRGSRLLVSTCSFKTDTNIDSVVWFLDEVWPLIVEAEPSARYEIIGHDPPDAIYEAAERAHGACVIGGVEDVREYLERAAASVVTMRAGSGSKIRALTSLAMGCPILATPLGAEGLEAGEREGVFIGSTPDALARHAIELLEQGQIRSSWAHSREYVERHHTWHRTVEQMKRTYGKTLS